MPDLNPGDTVFVKATVLPAHPVYKTDSPTIRPEQCPCLYIGDVPVQVVGVHSARPLWAARNPPSFEDCHIVKLYAAHPRKADDWEWYENSVIAQHASEGISIKAFRLIFGYEKLPLPGECIPLRIVAAKGDQ